MFWGLTLKGLEMLAERHRDRVKREDHRAGEIVAILYNANRDTEKDPEGKVWLDWYPEWKEPEPEQTEEEMFKTMLTLAAQTERFPA